MYKTVLFKGQWQKTLLGIVSEFGDSHFSLFFFSTSRFSSVRLCYLSPFPNTFIKYTIHLPFLSPMYNQSEKKKKYHTSQYQRKVKIHWCFCNKVQERFHIAHYLYSHWSWWPWSQGSSVYIRETGKVTGSGGNFLLDYPINYIYSKRDNLKSELWLGNEIKQC